MYKILFPASEMTHYKNSNMLKTTEAYWLKFDKIFV